MKSALSILQLRLHVTRPSTYQLNKKVNGDMDFAVCVHMPYRDLKLCFDTDSLEYTDPISYHLSRSRSPNCLNHPALSVPLVASTLVEIIQKLNSINYFIYIFIECLLSVRNVEC